MRQLFNQGKTGSSGYSFAEAFEKSVERLLRGHDSAFVDPDPISDLSSELRRTNLNVFKTSNPSDPNQDVTYTGHLFRELSDRRLKCPLLEKKDHGYYLLHRACTCSCGDALRQALEIRTQSTTSSLWCGVCGEVAPIAKRAGDLCDYGHPYEVLHRRHEINSPAYETSDEAKAWRKSLEMAANDPAFRYVGFNLPGALALVLHFDAAGAFVIDGGSDRGVDVVAVGFDKVVMAQVKATSGAAGADVLQKLRGSSLAYGDIDEALTHLEGLVKPDAEKLTGDLFDVARDACIEMDDPRHRVIISLNGTSQSEDVDSQKPVLQWSWQEIAAIISGAGCTRPEKFDDWVTLALEHNVVATRGSLSQVIGPRSRLATV